MNKFEVPGDITDIRIRQMPSIDRSLVLGIWWSPVPKNITDMFLLNVPGREDLSFVAEIDGMLIGFILAHIAYVGIPIDEVCYFQYICVRPDYQGKGIGRALMNELKKRCEKRGISKIRAIIPHSNCNILNLTEHLGFRAGDAVALEQTSSVS